MSTTAMLKFERDGPIRKDIVQAVHAYLDMPDVRRLAHRRIQTKAVLIGLWAVTSYLTLLLVADNWWQVCLAGLSVALSFNAVGFNIMHDGNHKGFSSHRRLNRAAGYTLDPMGGSSYVWRVKHNIAHHTYTNVAEYDEDIALAPLGRMSSFQEWHRYQKYQKYYLFFFYGFMTIRWQIVNDFRTLIRGKVGESRIRWPKGWNFVGFWGGKIVFVTLMIALPLITHWSWHGAVMVGLVYLGVSMAFSFVLALTFQLAHCVDEALFISPSDVDPESGKVKMEWYEYQIRTTADFCPNSRVLTWFMGGLNFQLEHHLFAKEAHIHYPAIAKIVRQKCAEHGLPYLCKPTLVQAIGAHVRHLHNMGQRPTAAPA
jgi:linoleoyl-CoA desaturase